MPTRRPTIIARTGFLAFLSGLLLLTVFGCGGSAPNLPKEKMPPITADVVEMGPGSLQVEVTDYAWRYQSRNKAILVYGNVVNNMGAPIHGAMISAVLYDQTGTPIAAGDAYIRPTYLKEGAKASFEFLSLTKKSKGVTATRLVYRTRPQGGY